MTSTLINTKTTTFSVNINAARAVSEDIMKMADAVKTVDEYREFVRTWKMFYADLTNVVRQARYARQTAYGFNSNIAAGTPEWTAEIIHAKGAAHFARQIMRPIGHAMSVLRVEMKAKLKAGNFVDTYERELEAVA